MRRRLFSCAFILLTVVGISLPALAQYEEEEPSKLSIRVGIYRPTGSTLRSEGNSTWKMLCIGYSLKLDEKGRPKTYAELERTAVDEYRLDAQMTGLTYTKLWYKEDKEVVNPEEEEPKIRGFYYGIGAGVYIVKEELREVWGSPSESNSGTKLGVSLTAGYNFNPNWFAEIRYNQMGKLAEGVDFSGFGLFVGTNQIF